MREIYKKQLILPLPIGSDMGIAREFIPNILLRDARKLNHWTQQEVAEKIGVAPLSVSRWERGKAVPSSYARRKLCLLFSMSNEELGFQDRKEPYAREENQGPIGADVNDVTLALEAETEENPQSWKNIGKRERMLRGWSQEELAQKVGVDVKTVRRWERGESLPRPYARRRLSQLLGKSIEELGVLEELRVPTARKTWEEKSFPTKRTITTNSPVHCGDCERPEITASFDTVVIEPSKDHTIFYFRFTNRTSENVGVKFESLSLIHPNGDFFLGQSVSSFLLTAGQSMPISVVFDWIPQQQILYRLNIVLIQPNNWRNTYQPILFMV